MKIGCCTSGYGNYLSLSDTVKEIGKKGFDYSEINTDGDIDLREKELISRYCSRYGIFIHLHINLNEIYAVSLLQNRDFYTFFLKKFQNLMTGPEFYFVRQISFDPLYTSLIKKELWKKQVPLLQFR